MKIKTDVKSFEDVQAALVQIQRYLTSTFISSEQTGTGSSQNIAHGLTKVPARVFVVPSNLTGGAYVVTLGTHTSTNCVVTVTSGEKYRVIATLYGPNV